MSDEEQQINIQHIEEELNKGTTSQQYEVNDYDFDDFQGHDGDDDIIIDYQEEHNDVIIDIDGECHGTPFRVERNVCPTCNGDYYKTKPCTICKKYTCEEKETVCGDCLKSLKDKFMNFYIELSVEEQEAFFTMIEKEF